MPYLLPWQICLLLKKQGAAVPEVILWMNLNQLQYCLALMITGPNPPRWERRQGKECFHQPVIWNILREARLDWHRENKCCVAFSSIGCGLEVCLHPNTAIIFAVFWGFLVSFSQFLFICNQVMFLNEWFMSATCQWVAYKRQDLCFSIFALLVRYLFSLVTLFISVSFCKSEFSEKSFCHSSKWISHYLRTKLSY